MEGEQTGDTPSPTTATPTPLPRKGAEWQPGPIAVVPVPLPRHLPAGDPGELNDKLTDEVLNESEKSESEASTKTSNSDSGIEDGKSTPTSEEKVPLHASYLEN